MTTQDATPAAAAGVEEMHALLRGSVRDLLRRAGGARLARAMRRREDAALADTWSAMARAGWLGILIAEASGGAGLGATEATIVAQELGAQAMPLPYTACALMPTVVLQPFAGNPLARSALQRLATGQAWFALAWQESLGGLDPRAVALEAHDTPRGVSLRGRKRYVVGAGQATEYLVSARSGGELALCLVGASQSGVTCHAHDAVDGTSYGSIDFDDVSIERAGVIARGDAVAAALRAAVRLGTLAAGAELVGVVQAALTITLEYMRTRVQFGRPIGSFQALQHRVADLYIQQELARAVLDEAIAALAHGGDWRAIDEKVCRAKARCSDAALRVTKEAIQLHGAIGYTDECDIGLYLKRAMVLASWLGTATAHRRRSALLAGELGAADDEGYAGAAAPVPPGGDLNTHSDSAFRALVRDFFEQRYPRALRNLPRRMRLDEAREWVKALCAQGWVAPSWPREHGGMGLDPGKLVILMEEQERAGVGRLPDIGVVNVGPLLIKYGTEAQIRTFLPKILTFEHVWCQGYSEPNAGSDLASVQTRALVDADTLVVTGQKIWTTAALDATHMFALVRTDPQAHRHEGLSFVLLDMRAPGVTVRPITNLAGHPEFCQVFLDGVRTPRDWVVGELNKGWEIAKALLGFERIFVGSPKRCQYALGRLRLFARKTGLVDDQGFCDRFDQMRADVADLSATYQRFVAALKRGERIGAEVSILKIWATESLQRIADLIFEAGAEHACIPAAFELDDERIDLVTPFFTGRWVTIGAGSSEIQRNILARNVLALPSK